MKKKIALLAFAFFLVITNSRDSFAFIMAVAEAAKTAKDEAYQKFMMIKAVEQLKTLRDNYEAGVRYYEMMKRLNEGQGIVANVAHQIGDIGEDTYRQAQQQINDEWINDPAYGSNVDQLVHKMDNYASDKVRYAGRVFEKSRDAEQEAVKISAQADTLDSKNTQRLMLRTQALQLQLAAQTNANMAQLLDLNTRMYKLQAEKKESEITDWSIFDKSIQILKQGRK